MYEIWLAPLRLREIAGDQVVVDAPRELRTREAAEAERWFQTITADCFG